MWSYRYEAVDSFIHTGKLIASRLPPKHLIVYRDYCPLCLSMKRKRNRRPGVSLDLAEDELSPWQEVNCDISGIFRTVSKSKQSLFFVDAKTGGKIFIAHQKKKHCPAVYSTSPRNGNRHFWGKQESSYFSLCYPGRQASEFPFSTEELGPSPRGSDPVSCRLTWVW